jgi:hypothetical protein
VEHLSGCFPNVVGLPLCRLHGLLEAQGAPPPSSITRKCWQQNQQAQQPCQVYLQVIEEV